MTTRKITLFAALALSAIMVLVTQVSTGAPAPNRIEITAKRFDFTPGDVTVKKGVPVTLVLTSQDVDHGLKFRELNVVLTAKKGQTSEVTFTPNTTGTFTGVCSVFCGSGHGSMKMTLHVTE